MKPRRFARAAVVLLALAAFLVPAAPVFSDAPPVPPPPMEKGLIVGDDGSLLLLQARLQPARLPSDTDLRPQTYRVYLLPVDPGTSEDLLGIGWYPDGLAGLISGGSGDVLRVRYPSLKVESMLPDLLKAEAPLNRLDWNAQPAMLAIWPPRFVDRALIAGSQVDGSGRLLMFAADGGAFQPVAAPDFDGVDLLDVSWHPTGLMAIAVGRTAHDSVAFLLDWRLSALMPVREFPTIKEIYRGPGGSLNAAAFSPDGTIALMVGDRPARNPHALARVLEYVTGTGETLDLSDQAQAAGIDLKDVAWKSPLPVLTTSPTAEPITPRLPPPIALLVGGDTQANIAAALAYTYIPGGSWFSPVLLRPGPALNGVAVGRDGLLAVAVCDQPAAGGNAPIIVLAPAGPVLVNSGIAHDLKAVSIRQVGEMRAWPFIPVPPVTWPLAAGDQYLEALDLGLQSNFSEASVLQALTVLLKCNADPGAALNVWAVADLNHNGVRDPDEPLLGQASVRCGEPTRLWFTDRPGIPRGQYLPVLLGIDFDAAPRSSLDLRLAVTGVLALGAESQRTLLVWGLPVVGPPVRTGALITNLQVSPNPFSPNGDGRKDNATITFSLSEPAACTLAAFNLAGQPVRTFLDHAPKPAGETSVQWDGKDDAGQALPDGPYRVRLSAAADGATCEAAAWLGMDTTPPSLRGVTVVPRSFSPNGDGRAEYARIYFWVDGLCRVSVGAYSGSTLVSQVFDASVLPGWHSAVWNGRSGGAVVRDGEYGIVVQAHDAADNYTDPGLARVTVDTQRPRIVNLRADPSAFSPDGDGVDDTATISYRLSEWSRVYVVVAGQGLRFNLAAGEWQLSGDHSLVWDGLTAAGHPVPPGTYWVAALAIDPAFNMSFIPVTQVTVAPSWAPVTGP